MTSAVAAVYDSTGPMYRPPTLPPPPISPSPSPSTPPLPPTFPVPLPSPSSPPSCSVVYFVKSERDKVSRRKAGGEPSESGRCEPNTERPGTVRRFRRNLLGTMLGCSMDFSTTKHFLKDYARTLLRRCMDTPAHFLDFTGNLFGLYMGAQEVS